MRRRRPTPIIASLTTHLAPYVTLPSLKLYWQVEYQTLRKWVQDGYLPAYRFGRMWRVRTEDARAFYADWKGLPRVEPPKALQPEQPPPVDLSEEPTNRSVTSVEELTEDATAFLVTRQNRARFNSPIIYAAFDKDGSCLYVGKSNSYHRVLFQKHHRLDTAPWATIRVWRANVRTDAELCVLELAAIEALNPLLNERRAQTPREVVFAVEALSG